MVTGRTLNSSGFEKKLSSPSLPGGSPPSFLASILLNTQLGAVFLWDIHRGHAPCRPARPTTEVGVPQSGSINELGVPQSLPLRWVSPVRVPAPRHRRRQGRAGASCPPPGSPCRTPGSVWARRTGPHHRPRHPLPVAVRPPIAADDACHFRNRELRLTRNYAREPSEIAPLIRYFFEPRGSLFAPPGQST